MVGPFVAARGLTQDAQIATGGDDAVAVFEDFFLPLIRQRRRQPTGDLTSRLIADPIDGMTMSDEQMLLLLSSNFYAASIFTIRLFVGTLTMAMATHPEVYRQVRSDRSLIPVAVEEVLRWDAPAQAVNAALATRTSRSGTSPSPPVRRSRRWSGRPTGTRVTSPTPTRYAWTGPPTAICRSPRECTSAWA